MTSYDQIGQDGGLFDMHEMTCVGYGDELASGLLDRGELLGTRDMVAVSPHQQHRFLPLCD